VKLGQFLATRGDILPVFLRQELAQLQDRVPPFSQDQARSLVEQSLGHSIEELFSEFGEVVAAASVAQVHYAVLHSGEEVAVKILRPDIRKKFDQDLIYFDHMAALLERWVVKSRRLRPVMIIKLLREWIALELNLCYEAAAASEYREVNEREGGFYVPRVMWDYTTDKIMVLERLKGIPFTQMDTILKSNFDLKAIASQLLQIFLQQATTHGFFHGDLHQGNLFLLETGELAVVDFGVMGRLDEDTRRFLAEILYGFVVKDYKRVAEVHFEAGYVPKYHSIDQFSQALRSVGEPIFGRKATEISMGRVLSHLFQVAQSFEMETQPQLVLLQKTMVSVEGVARSLDPEANIWEAARPVMENWVKSHIGIQGQVKRFSKKAFRQFSKIPDLIDQAERVLNLLEKSFSEKNKK
jgi:ubiquinone biosynthesis protein